MKSLFILTLLATSTLLQAELRSWKSSNGKKTLEAHFLSRDETNITLRRLDGRVLTFSIDKLHQSDQTFLDKKYPYQDSSKIEALTGDAFGPLKFGDTRTEVEDKLAASALVKTSVQKTLFGRTGLNGIYETSQTIGGLSCFLYFDWNDDDKLQEVTLRSEGLTSEDYSNKLQETWKELIVLLDKLHGKPLSSSAFPKASELQDGLILASHLWRTSDGYSVLLGSGQDRDDYNVSVRFTSERVPNIATP